MLKTPDWAAGAEYLREHAPELIPLIDRFPVCELKPEPKEKYFGTLVTVLFHSSYHLMSVCNYWKN